jgi:signal transduction histidine kinase
MKLQLSRELARSREQAAIHTVASFFVHDMKNTANTLSLTLQNLPRRFEDAEFRADALNGIRRSVDRLNRPVRELGILRDRVILNASPTELEAIVKETLRNLQEAHSLPLRMQFESLPPVELDREQIEKVITNLVLNAGDALRPGGQIRVTVARRDSHAVLTVADDGCGMTDEFIRGSLFRPFQTTKNKGIGIGLYHARQIVEAHCGWIEVESIPERGSTFRVVLPLQHRSKKSTSVSVIQPIGSASRESSAAAA